MRKIIKSILACLIMGILFLVLPSTDVIAQELAEEGIIAGRIFLDSNGDGILDPDEVGIPDAYLLAEGQGVQITIMTDQNGDFSLQVPWGTWTIVPIIPDGYEFVGPETQELVLDQSENLDAYVLFGFKAKEPLEEVVDDPVISEETQDNSEEELEDPETSDDVETQETEDPEDDDISNDLEDKDDGRINILPESGAIFPHLMIAIVILMVFLLGLGLVILSAILGRRQPK